MCGGEGENNYGMEDGKRWEENEGEKSGIREKKFEE